MSKYLRIILVFTCFWCFVISNRKHKKSGHNVLVVINGQWRGGEVAWDSLQKYVLDYYNADLAYIGPHDNRSETSHLKRLSRFWWEVPEFDDWGEVLNEIGGKDLRWRKMCNLEKAQFLGGVRNCHQGSAGILLCYRNMFKQQWDHHSLSHIYDWVIYTRSDYVYLCSPPNLHCLNSDHVYIPYGEEYNGFTDRFAIVSSNLVPIFFNLTKNLISNPDYWYDRFKQVDYINLELLIKLFANYVNIPIRQFSHVAFTVKPSYYPPRWSAGASYLALNPYHLIAKYPPEVKMANATCDPWMQLKLRSDPNSEFYQSC
jgi:hypothetical protein